MIFLKGINGNESESTCEDDCVVPSLPQDEVKQSPQHHETVLRMNNSLSDYKHVTAFKNGSDLTNYKNERNLGFKTEMPDDNNNNRLRVNSYSSEDDNLRYASQADDPFRYGSHPDNSNTFRCGLESNNNNNNNSRFEDSLRLGSQGYSPKPSYRDYWRDNYRDGLRSDFHQRLSAMQDYYLQRSMTSQDRYPGVIGYSRAETPSRLNYPRFDYSARNYGMNRYDAAKAESYPNQSPFENRSEFPKPNEKYFRSPGEYSAREDYTTLKSGEEVPRIPFRNSLPLRSSSDEFVKPTVSRSEFALRQSAAAKELSQKGERTSSTSSTNHFDDREEREQSMIGNKERNLEVKEMKEEMIELKSQKTDFNGNTGKAYFK